MTKGLDDDGRIARDRCLATMITCTDIETRRSLWRAAVRYSQKKASASAVLGDECRGLARMDTEGSIMRSEG